MATLIKQVKGFVTRQNNAGASGLALFTSCVDHMFEHGDWTPLAWLIAKTASRDGAAFRSILGAVTGGVSIVTTSKEAKEQPSGIVIKVKDNAGPSDKMTLLREMVDEGVSFRSNAIRERLLEKEKPEFDLKAYASRLVKKLDKEGYTLKDLLDAA